MKVLSILEEPALYKEISDEDFEHLIIKQGLSALVTIADEGMRSAAMMNAIMEGLCQEYGARLSFFYSNPETSNLSEIYGLYDTAAVFFFAYGILEDYQIGLVAKHQMRQKIEKFLIFINP